MLNIRDLYGLGDMDVTIDDIPETELHDLESVIKPEEVEVQKFNLLEDTFRCYMRRSLIADIKAIEMMQMNQEENFGSDFELKVRRDPIVKERLTLTDMINLNTMSMDIKFVDREQIPICYDIILKLIRKMEDNIGLPTFDMSLLTRTYDLADYFFDNYNRRIKLYFTEVMVSHRTTYVGDSVDEVIFDRVVRQGDAARPTKKTVMVGDTKYIDTSNNKERKWV